MIDILKLAPHTRRLVLSRELEDRLNLRGASIRVIVKNARRLGVPIGSCGEGYFYARNFNELADTMHHLKERRDSLTYTLRALEKCYPDECQTELL